MLHFITLLPNKEDTTELEIKKIQLNLKTYFNILIANVFRRSSPTGEFYDNHRVMVHVNRKTRPSLPGQGNGSKNVIS